MELTDIQKGLNNFTEELTSQTYPHTYRVQKRDSLLADGLGTRANSIWKMAQYIVATYDNKKDVPLDSYLNGWKTLVKNYKDQILIIEIDDEHHWQMYDSYSNLLGNEQYIVEFLQKHTKASLSDATYASYLSALRAKPFVLLAGISGTGKSRIVRKLAQATNPKTYAKDEDRWKDNRPDNFELIQVKPNWHNSMDLVGYYSNVNGKYTCPKFVKFIAKAWLDQ